MVDIHDICGVIPPVVTPVDSNENLDEPAFKRVLDRCISGGVHGIFVLGSNGEFFAFDPETYERIIRVAVEHVQGRVPVYAGASAITTNQCMHLAGIAEAAGADAVTVLAPMFLRLSDQELYDHYRVIAESISLPLILYNNPGKTANDLSPGLVKRLAEVDNIMGIKNSSLNFAQAVQYIDATRDNEKFHVLGGSDFYIYATLAYGGYGCVAGTANVAPELIVEIYTRFMKGDHEGAIQCQNRLLPLRHAQEFGSFPVVIKECLNLMGMDVGSPIAPLQRVRQDRLEDLKTILKDLDLL